MSAREAVVGIGVLAAAALGVAIILVGCTPSGPVPPVAAPEGGSADACAIALAVCQARLIREPDGGALCVPCPK